MARVSPRLLIGAGAIGLGILAFTQRRRITQGVAKVAEKILDTVANAPLSMPIPPYATLPLGPPEIGPLAADRSLDALRSDYKPRVVALNADLNTLLAPFGAKAVITETTRTGLRQVYLWGIGRFYQAPGRTGIVTKVREANAKHRSGEAVDFAYMSSGKSLPTHDAAAKPLPWFAALVANASALEAKHTVKWGGHFKGDFKDWPHWEVA